MKKNINMEIKTYTLNTFPTSGDLDLKIIWYYPQWKYIKGNSNMDEPKYLTQNHLYQPRPQTKLLVLLRNPVEKYT